MQEPDFDGRYVRETEVQEWITNVVVGRITKKKLDEERNSEVN